MYPLAVSKGFANVFTNRRTNKRKTNYSYHVVDGLTIRTSSDSNNECENNVKCGVIKCKTRSNIGELKIDNKSSFYLGRHIIRDGDR